MTASERLSPTGVPHHVHQRRIPAPADEDSQKSPLDRYCHAQKMSSSGSAGSALAGFFCCAPAGGVAAGGWAAPAGC